MHEVLNDRPPPGKLGGFVGAIILVLAVFLSALVGCGISNAPKSPGEFGTLAVKPAPTATPDPCAKFYGKGYCVDFPELPIHFKRNADTWYFQAQAANDQASRNGQSLPYKLSGTPEVGAIAVYSLPHVGVVLAVTKNPEGTVKSYRLAHWNWGNPNKKAPAACLVTVNFGVRTELEVAAKKTSPNKYLLGFVSMNTVPTPAPTPTATPIPAPTATPSVLIPQPVPTLVLTVFGRTYTASGFSPGDWTSGYITNPNTTTQAGIYAQADTSGRVTGTLDAARFFESGNYYFKVLQNRTGKYTNTVTIPN